MVKPNIEVCGNGACLGAEMRFSASGGHEKYCQNGGMTLAHHQGAASREGVRPEGSPIAVMAPSWSQEASLLQGKSLVSAFRAL